MLKPKSETAFNEQLSYKSMRMLEHFAPKRSSASLTQNPLFLRGKIYVGKEDGGREFAQF